MRLMKKKPSDNIQHNDENCEITYGDKVVAGWNDEANTQYPEDLTWARTIGDLVSKAFDAGFEAGLAERQVEIDRHKSAVDFYTQKIHELQVGMQKALELKLRK